MTRHHGDVDEFVIETGTPPQLAETDYSGPAAVVGRRSVNQNPDPGAAQRKFRFGLMFQNPPLPEFRLADPQGLVDLGTSMEAGPDLGDHPTLRAGYAFFGQFLAHDLSFDQTQGVPAGGLTPQQISSGRSPTLDLDSLYGNGSAINPELYQSDGVKLKIGKTTKTFFGNANQEFDNDLPRDATNSLNPRTPLIGDSRNDDNLAVAQTTVAFIKFHNVVADRLAASGLSGNALFEAARKKVVQHYQWIVLNDYLPKMVETDVLDDVKKNGPQHFRLDPGIEPFMPAEFAFAAFRFGHSMLRGHYEWNRVFHSGNPGQDRGEMAAPTLFRLFEFTGSNGNMQGTSLTLPSNWIIDWTRFYDFTGFAGWTNNLQSNFSKRINTTLTPTPRVLLPMFAKIGQEQYRTLAVLDLIRGNSLGLPTGQDVAKRLNVEPLSPDQLLQPPNQDAMKQYGFDQQTPLWYYILKEAERLHNGQCLGPVGSRIVAETLFGLTRASRVSILKEDNWKPDLGQNRADEFGMTDLLIAADVVNPLGN